MTISTAKTSEAQQKLMTEIGMAIMRVTMISPMPIDDIVGVLAFTTGAAIGNNPNKAIFRTKDLRQMAVANIDHAIDAALKAQQSPLILPANFN